MKGAAKWVATWGGLARLGPDRQDFDVFRPDPDQLTAGTGTRTALIARPSSKLPSG